MPTTQAMAQGAQQVQQLEGSVFAAIPEIYRARQGRKQQKEAKKLQKGLKRPVYQTPEAIQEQINRARLAASGTTIPGQARIEENIRGTTSDALNASKELGNRDVSGVFAGQKAAMRDLGLSVADNYQARQANLSSALGTAGVYQEKAWDYNKRSPYEEGVMKAAAMQEAGNQNVMGAISNLGAIAQGAVGGSNKTGTTGKTPTDPNMLGKYNSYLSDKTQTAPASGAPSPSVMMQSLPPNQQQAISQSPYGTQIQAEIESTQTLPSYQRQQAIDEILAKYGI